MQMYQFKGYSLLILKGVCVQVAVHKLQKKLVYIVFSLNGKPFDRICNLEGEHIRGYMELELNQIFNSSFLFIAIKVNMYGFFLPRNQFNLIKIGTRHDLVKLGHITLNQDTN